MLSDITFIMYITFILVKHFKFDVNRNLCSLHNFFLSAGTRKSPWGKDQKGENYDQKKRKSTRSYRVLGNLSATYLSTCYINSWFFFVLILIVVLYLFHFWADFEGRRGWTGVWVWKVNVLSAKYSIWFIQVQWTGESKKRKGKSVQGQVEGIKSQEWSTIHKVRIYDGGNHTSCRDSTSHKDHTSHEDSTSCNGSTTLHKDSTSCNGSTTLHKDSTSCNGSTSRKNSEPDLPCTPEKCSMPSYYKVFSTSKQVQHLLGPSLKTHDFETRFKQRHQVTKKEQVHGCIYTTSQKFCHATKAVTWKIITQDSCANKPEEIKGCQEIS